MRQNNLFTYLLYALLGGLILTAGYLALERRKELAQKDEQMRLDQAEVDRAIQETSTVDTSRSTGSTYAGDKSSSVATPSASTPASTTTTPAAGSKTAVKQPAATTTAPTTAAKTPTTATPKPTTPAKTLVSKGASKPNSVAAPTSTGRYQVVVGAFSQISNARTEMERFVKMGYLNAEVVKYKTDLWRVLAKRTNNRADAEKTEATLEQQGIDAQVVDSAKK